MSAEERYEAAKKAASEARAVYLKFHCEVTMPAAWDMEDDKPGAHAAYTKAIKNDREVKLAMTEAEANLENAFQDYLKALKK